MNCSTIPSVVLALSSFAAAPCAHAIEGGATATASPRPDASLPTQPQLDRGLNRILGSPTPLASAANQGFRVRDDRIQVVAVTGSPLDAARLEEWLAAHDAAFISSAAKLVQAHIPPDIIDDLSAHPLVHYVRKPLYYFETVSTPKSLHHTQKSGPFLTEGFAASNADIWHAAEFYGTGISVGIIDQGLGGFDLLYDTELPPADRVTAVTFGGTILDPDEKDGTACAEIIYDFVPATSHMYLALVSTDIDVANAIDWMSENNVDVVSTSLGWLSWGPGDGTGIIADAVADFVADGGVYVNAAGNARLAHWQGEWVDDDGDGFLDFAPDTEINFVTENGVDLAWLSFGDFISAAMIWNQWQAPDTDLAFYVYRWNGFSDPIEVQISDEIQSGIIGQSPVEELQLSVLGAGYYGFSVFHNGGPLPVDIEFFSRFDSRPLQYNIQSGSITPPADASDAIAVAALDAGSPFSLEDCSSAGPTNGPGGSIAGGSTKPDISGFANVSTDSYGARTGPQPFKGTSAACPHVAGAAALVWSAHPEWTNQQVRSFLESRAIDMGPPGMDNDFGHGRLWLGDPSLECSYSLDPTAASFGAPGGSASFSVETQGGCGWSAASADGWIHIVVGSSGTGPGTVSFNVDQNPSPDPRSGTITVEDLVFTVTQSGQQVCTYAITPTAESFPAGGGGGSISITTDADCGWTASDNHDWIDITGGSSGSGPGTATYQVDANPGEERSGAITAAGHTHTVNQAGTEPCTYAISPTSRSFGPGGGAGTVSVDTTVNCSWTATSNNSGWLHVTGGGSGSGSDIVTYSVDTNPGGLRTGSLTVAGNTHTVSQTGDLGGPFYYLVPGVAHVTGVNDSVWRTSLSVTNRSGTATDLTLYYHTDDGTVIRTHIIPNNSITEWVDIAQSLFDRDENSAGSIEIISATPVIISSRTYNEVDAGTFGQSMPAMEASSSALVPGVIGVLPDIRKTAAFRTNIGFQNLSTVMTTVRVTLHGANGAELGDPIHAAVGALQWQQINDVFGQADVDYLELGFATVEVLTPGGSVWAYASVVDNQTGDPTTVPVFVQ